MKGIGGKAVVCGSAAGTQPFDNAVINQKIQNAVNRYPVDRTASLQGFVDVSGRQREAVVADDFEDPQTALCQFQSGGG